MSTARSVSKAKTAASGSLASKKAASASAASTGSSENVNLHGNPVAKKSSVTRASLVPNALTTPITPRSGMHTATSRVPTSAKQTDNSTKTISAAPKTIDTWTPLPTPVAMSSSRSFSELMKSEESLQARVNQLQALVESQQAALMEKELEIKQLKSEVMSTQEGANKIHRAWEAKSEALVAQQQEKYRDLNERYLVVLTRARDCEAKLEELFIDPLSLLPFGSKGKEIADAESTLESRRSLLALVEEHQHKQESHMERSKRDMEALLSQTMQEIRLDAQNEIEDLIASARASTPTYSDEELRKIQIGIPMLIQEAQNDATPDSGDDSDGLDWSIATTDGEDSPSSPSQNFLPQPFDTDLNTHSVPWRLNHDTTNEDGIESGADDSFFNDSVYEGTD